MSFKLEILTPKMQFYKGDVDSVTVTLSDGEMTVLSHHSPMLAALSAGYVRIRTGSDTRTAFSSEGFIEIRPDEVLIFTQVCEWPEDIDVARAEDERETALEELRQKQSMIEYRQTKIALSRAMARLRVKGNQKI